MTSTFPSENKVMQNSDRLLLLWVDDNVLVATRQIEKGTELAIDGQLISLPQGLALGHKVARRAISAGETVTKYGAPIGHATQAIAIGEHVHLHNVASNYTATHSAEDEMESR